MPDQDPSKQKKILFGATVVVFIVVGLFLVAHFANKQSPPLTQTGQTLVPTVASELARKTTYLCDNNFSLDVIFTDNQAALTLSDGRTMTLLQTPVTEGVEFTNGDGSFIFLTKGPSAAVTEKGIVTHSDCIEPKG